MGKGHIRITSLLASTTATLVDSASLHFSVDYEQMKHISIDEVVSSEVLSVGEHLWRIDLHKKDKMLNFYIE